MTRYSKMFGLSKGVTTKLLFGSQCMDSPSLIIYASSPLTALTDWAVEEYQGIK